MATTYKEAQEMEELSKKFNVPLLVNFETSWYESTYEAKKLLETDSFGSLTKMVFNTGHPGPQEIGCTPEFLDWLTDPILNGGGALTDFGCYGANIATWLLNGETPLRVSCVAKQSKPDRYPKVDDDTTIILDYEKKKVVIQASWNWSHNRKDMQIYGSKGYVNCKNAKDMILMKNEQVGEKKHIPQPISEAKKDPFRLLYEVVYKDVILEPYSLYSIENNLIVSKILSLASESSKTQKTQNW
jgi:predicted dehydrogenase